MTFDQILGLLGTLMGLLGIILAYVFYRKSVRTKVLMVAYTDPIPLVMTLGNITVSYQDTVISALSRIYILVFNRGTVAIEAIDFISPISIKSEEPLLTLKIHDKDATVSAELDNNNCLNIALLRPGEAITIVAEVASAKPRLAIDIKMKSADMSVFSRGLHALYSVLSGLFVTVFGYICLGLLIYFSVRTSSVPPNTPRPFNPSEATSWLMAVLFIVIFVMPVGLGILTTHLVAKLMERTTTPVAWTFFKMKVLAMNLRISGKDFRKSIDQANKTI